MKNLKKLVLDVLKSDSKISDLFSFIISKLFHPRFLKHVQVRYKNQGVFRRCGMINFGVFSNRLGLDPNAAGVLRIYKGGRFTVDDNVRIARDCKIYVAGELSIGSNTYLNPNTLVVAREQVRIGRDCAISWNCQIIDDDLHRFVVAGVEKKSSASIDIGDHVWIGSNVTILKGVKIGNNSVIASGSIVTKDVPENSLFGGVPAKSLKSGIAWK